MTLGIKYFLAGLKKRRSERCCKRQELIKEFMREYLELQKQREFQEDEQKRPGPVENAHPYGHFHQNMQFQHKRFMQEHREFRRRHREFLKKHQQFSRYHRRLKYVRPIIIVFNLAIWYVIFRYLGIKFISVFFAALISIGGIVEIFFLRHLEKRVFEPIEQLKKGVEEIARGNYSVRVECNVLNDITLLVASFNDMAQKLQEGEKLKSDYEENRKTLIANISHDLKTPITAIQGYIEAIMDRSDLSGENTARYLQIIYHNTTYMNRLIDDLFLFSRLDLQKLDFNCECIKASLFMADLMEEFKLELEEKHIEFVFTDQTGQECLVNIDRKRIQQAIRNIIGNAVRYGPEQGLSIKTAMYRQGGRVCIEIGDNGPGIPPDRLPFIFNRFYRLDSERTKDVMSTGLGLSIARELVEAHGGDISAESPEGGGSRFTIRLPVVEDHGRLQQ